MKSIALSQGQYALVDDEDFPSLSKHKWFAHRDGHTYYALRNINIGKNKSTTIRMHRIILNTPDGMHTDHINGDGIDNRKGNLRICTKQQNDMSKRKYKKGTSAYKGVHWCSRDKRWVAKVHYNNHKIYAGYFRNEKDAAKAYNESAKKLFGEFALLNVIND